MQSGEGLSGSKWGEGVNIRPQICLEYKSARHCLLISGVQLSGWLEILKLTPQQNYIIAYINLINLLFKYIICFKECNSEC